MSQQIQISGGAKVRDLQDVIIGTSGVLSSLAFNVANGVPKLDVNGKILVSQLPNSVMEYKGVWNAATNTPTLVNGTGNQGDVYLCNVAGTVNFGAGPIAFVVGDQVIYSSVAEGSIWQRASGATGTVTSVALTESGDSLNITGSPITTSGTINIGFNGTNLQYVNGAGNLTTFPILTGYVPYTGATQDVDLGAFKLNAQSLHIKGTGGLGHLGLKHQSASATASANEVSLFADSLGNLSWLNGNLYLSKFITSGNTAARSYTFPNANGTVALTSDLTGYLTAVTATSPLSSSGGTTPNITIAQATTSANGYLSSTDWNTFNGKQNAITLTTTGSSGVSTLVGATLNIPDYGSALTGYVTLATTQTITGAKTFSAYTTFTSTVDITSGLTFSNSGFTLVLQPPTLSVNRTVTLPNGTGTLALTSDISYPVTSVFGRTGAVVAVSADYNTSQVTEVTNLYFTDSRARLALSFAAGSGAYNSTTGVITIPTNNNQITNGAGYITGNQTITLSGDVSGSGTTAITTTIGALKVTNAMLAGSIDLTTKVTGLLPDGNISSAATWNAKQNAITLTTTGTSGAATLVGATLNIPQYTDTYTGTVTSVAALTIGTSGTDLSSSVANSTTTPVITLNVPTASATNRGALSSADWTAFNNKQSALTNPVTGTGTTNYLPKFTGASTIGNSVIQESSSLIGINVTPTRVLHLSSSGTNAAIRLDNTTSGRPFLLTYDDSQNLTFINSSDSGYIAFNSGTGTSTTKMLLTNSGNLGLGVTPSAWNTVTAFQVGSTSLGGYSNTGYLSTNAFYQSGWKYINTSYAARYEINSGDAGVHAWYTAPSGTAGAAITFTQAMTLTASGRLLIGTPTESTYLLDVNGTGRFSGALTATQINLGGGAAQNQLQNAANNDFILSNSGNFRIINNANTVALLTITNAGAATFSSSVQAVGTMFLQRASGGASTTIQFKNEIGNNRAKILFGGSVEELGFYAGDGSVANLTIAQTGAATFSSSVTANGYFALTTTSDAYATQGTLSWNSARGTVISGKTASVYDFAVYGAAAQSLIANPTGTSNISFPSGNVLIGTTTDAGYKLDVSGTGRFSGDLRVNTSSKIFYESGAGTGNSIYRDPANGNSIFTSPVDFRFTNGNATTTYLRLESSSGAATFSSSVTATSFFESSDSRLKTLIQDNYQTKGIASITPKLYTKNGKVELGYYAQDFVGILDSAVSKGSDDMLSLSYREVHTAKIYALEQEIKELKAKLN